MLKFKVYSNSPGTSPSRIFLNSEVIGPRNKNWQKTHRFHGNRALNEIFFKRTWVTRYDPPHNKSYELYTIVEVFDEPLPILKKLLCHFGTKTSKMAKFIRKK
jgi:hypothetical protein